MPTLLMRLVGPMQSWGADSRFGERGTLNEPTKSGVIGLLCAAIGRDRGEPIDDLSRLRMGVRVDREGHLMCDYHTALDVPNSAGTHRDTVVSNRWYLADAAFLVGIEGDDQVQLLSLHAALRSPRWHLSLGRRACVPSEPVWMKDAVVELSLSLALKAWPSLVELSPDAAPARCVFDDPEGPQTRPDLPIAPFIQRSFGIRRVRTEYVSWNSPA